MAAKSIKLTAPNGTTVSVAADKEESLLARGFTKPSASTSTKTTAKRASSSKSEK